MTVHTTKSQFRLFEEECQSWADKLGLKDWCVFTRHEDLCAENTLAQCQWLTGQRIANLVLNTTVSTPKSDFEVRRAALHECLELLLICCTEAMRKGVPEDVVDTETHKVIRVLENLLLGAPR